MISVPESMPYRIALVIDNVVQQILYCNAEDAAKFLSQPKFYEITGSDPVENGFMFDGENFVKTVFLQ